MTAWLKNFPRNQKKKLLHRAPRVKLGALENCWLIYQEENLIQKFALHNISTSGLGFLISEPCPFQVNSTYEGTLNLGDKKIAVRFRVVYISENFLGATFEQSADTLAAEIHDYLKVQILAHSLAPVSGKFLAPELQAKATWFTDGKNNEIFFIIENDVITHFHFSFLGNHLTGGLNKELLFGRLNHKDDLEPWIEWNTLNGNEWRATLPNMAKQFLQQISTIPEPTKKLLVSALESSLAYRPKS